MSSGVERCRGVSSGVEGCRGVSRCRVWHLDTVEHGFSLDGVEGCRGVSRGVELVELAWGVEVSSWCRVGVEVWCRGVEARAQPARQAMKTLPHASMTYHCVRSVAENLINCFVSPYALGTRTALLIPGQGCKGTH